MYLAKYVLSRRCDLDEFLGGLLYLCSPVGYGRGHQVRDKEPLLYATANLHSLDIPVDLLHTKTFPDPLRDLQLLVVLVQGVQAWVGILEWALHLLCLKFSPPIYDHHAKFCVIPGR